jgi:hypothetical protein
MIKHYLGVLIVGKSKSLNGYWIKKADPNIKIFVEKVFKKGYVTGFEYITINGVEYPSMTPLRISHEELKSEYEQVKYS